jgi:hypothetical protein
MDDYITVLYEIITKGLNANSYKFALWRALANLAPTTNETNPKISKQDLAHCPPSALMRQIGWVEEGRISGSS